MAFRYFSPLSHFISDTDEFQVTKYLKIKRDAFELRQIDGDYNLAQWEQIQIRSCSHWLIAEKAPKYFRNSSEVFNTFLLAIWIYSPSHVSIGFKFGVGASEEKYSRLHDSFQFNSVDENKDVYDQSDLEKIREIFLKLARIGRVGKRIYATTVYSVFACFQVNWKSAFILSSTALESLLTYGARNDVTNKLARAFCCFTESNKYRRDLAFKKFKKVYRVRSELVHGRFIKRDDSRRNLNNLSIVTAVLRKMWISVLNNPSALDELEKEDVDRENFFLGITRGYVNP